MKLALAGDTMLGRRVAERLTSGESAGMFSEEVADVAHEADLFLLNLECAISERGQPWPDPWKPFFVRAPPVAAETWAAWESTASRASFVRLVGAHGFPR